MQLTRGWEVSQGQSQKSDLDKLEKRIEMEKMKFMEDKCKVLRCGREIRHANSKLGHSWRCRAMQAGNGCAGVCGHLHVQSSTRSCRECGLKDAPLGACTVGRPLPSSSSAFCFPHVLIAQAPNWIQPEILYSADLILTAQQGVLGWLQPLCVNNLIYQKNLPGPKSNLYLNTPVQAMKALSRCKVTSKTCCRQQDKTKSAAGEIRG